MALAEFFVVDVGHGNAGLLNDGNTAVVIDCAPAKALLDLIRVQQIHTVDALFISHADHDHIGGATGLLSANDIEVRAVYVAPDATKDTESWADFRVAVADARRRNGLKVITALNAATPHAVRIGRFDVVVPYPSGEEALGGPGADAGGHRATSNDMSAVLHVLFDGEPVALYAADATSWSIRRLLGSGTDVAAPVLVFPHHGALIMPTAVVDELLDAVRPRYSLFSHGRRMFRNPRPEMVAVAKRHGAKAVCTQLSMHCAPAQNYVGRNPEYPSAGIVGRLCCAGTIRFDLPVTAYDARDAHADFVAVLPSPMCV